ncbi:flagellar hook-basal body complex protein FliE [Paraliobacillus salinarum]|uniref:flagellar hook-basal body complex protein FliE n=1 Tax=Paraliobacillus salinarum TaxID=1158996 RepID=UPI0015F62DDB|nr:flagellar hook-basal body complex protein FliE [Paraliobacillus salinarum]
MTNGIVNLQLTPNNSVQTNQSTRISPNKAQAQFASSLKEAINQLNTSQVVSDEKTKALVNGEIDDLHDVMITAQKASITLNTAVEVQKKAIDAYNEIMRMQI